jgi:ATP-grasp domain, R2K clade family 2
LEAQTFVKPAEGKVFEPQVFASGDALPTVEQVGDITVLTSTPVSWVFEARCFVLERQIMAISPYWRNGALAQDSDGTWPFLGSEECDARCFVSTMLQSIEVSLPIACVFDIGLIEGAGWAVIEANPAWGAGLYGCSPMAVLNTIRRTVRARDQISAEHQPWVGVRNRQPPQH